MRRRTPAGAAAAALSLAIAIAGCRSAPGFSTPGVGRDPPAVIGRWDHGVDGKLPITIEFEPGGGGCIAGMCGLESFPGEGTFRWRLDGWRLRMSWPNPTAPGGSWEDDCVVSGDGDSYAGSNQIGSLIRGSRRDE